MQVQTGTQLEYFIVGINVPLLEGMSSGSGSMACTEKSNVYAGSQHSNNKGTISKAKDCSKRAVTAATLVKGAVSTLYKNVTVCICKTDSSALGQAIKVEESNTETGLDVVSASKFVGLGVVNGSVEGTDEGESDGAPDFVGAIVGSMDGASLGLADAEGESVPRSDGCTVGTSLLVGRVEKVGLMLGLFPSLFIDSAKASC